jgi:4-amino-4-deoxy-L-arabinose transferase-like glycosyltransferase
MSATDCTDRPEPATGLRGRPWWLEIEAAALVGLVVVAYFLRAGTMPIQGEEPTRAQIAFEMVHTGDWLVPREQDEPFITRPPLQNWLIAASCLALGSWDAWAVRFHSLLATLLTTLLVYGYGRRFLTPLGALAAGAAFATFGHMFTKGAQAETDALFIFLVGGSLLLWHWGLMSRWPEFVTYGLGYGLMALGMMTKGLQAPTYFVGGVVAYMLVMRQWRQIFCWGHLLGALFGASIVLAWLIPYGLQLGWFAVYSVWLGDAAMQSGGDVLGWNWKQGLAHLAWYPLAVAAATLPWSPLLLPYLSRDFLRRLGAARPWVIFLSCSLAVAFPTCWLPPLGLTRYFAPMYPCLAVLIGLVVQRCAEADLVSSLSRAWQRYLLTMVGGMSMVAGLVALLGVGASLAALAPLALPSLVALAYAGSCLALAFLVWRMRKTVEPQRVRWVVLAVAGFMVVVFTGVATDIRLRQSEDAATAMSRLKEQLPPGQALVSFGENLDCLFTYYYGLPIITPRPWPGAADGADLDYFCFMGTGSDRPELPFAWEEIAAVPMDRRHRDTPERVVVVGRRLPHAPAAGTVTRAQPGQPSW